MINLGFFSSSLFTLLSLLNDLLFSLIHGFLVLILGILVIIMLGTLIQIIIYYTLIIRKDILSKFERMEDEKVKEHENEKLARDLRIFLNDYNEKKSQELYKKINNIKDHSLSGLFSYIKKPLEMGSSG